MTKETQKGLIKKNQLLPYELTEIQQLVRICEAYDASRLPESWFLLREHSAGIALDFCYYEDDMLVGYLALERGVDECYLCGMVHPTYRERGIFRALVAAAFDECQQYRSPIQRLVLICNRTAKAGQAYIRRTGARYEFSEHEMLLTDFRPRTMFDERLVIERAAVEDLETLVMIQSQSFGAPEEAVRRRISSMMLLSSCHYYLARFGDEQVGCREPVSSFRLEFQEREVGLYAFGVLPAYRRRGYGRQILEEIVEQLQSRTTSVPRFKLLVEIDNQPAMSLYRSCGFQVTATYEYYELPFNESA